MKIKSILCFIIIVSIPYFSYSQIINVSDNISESTHPFITSNNGIIYAFWNDDLNGSSDIFFKYKQYQTWSETEIIETSGDSRLLKVVSDSANEIHLLWKEIENNLNRLVYGKIVNFSLIDTSEIISYDSTYIISASLFIENYVSHVCWDIADYNVVNIYYSSKVSNNPWSEAQLLYSNEVIANYPHSQLIKDINDDLFCFWLSTDSTLIDYVIQLDPDNWSPIYYLSGGFGVNFIIGVDDSLHIHLASNHAALTCPCIGLLYTKWDGFSWTEIEEVPFDDMNAEMTERVDPDLSFTSDNQPVITWEQHGFHNLIEIKNCIGTAIKTDTSWYINSNIACFRKPLLPKIIIDNSDLINYVWQDSTDGDFDIYYQKKELFVDVDPYEDIYTNELGLCQNFPNPFRSKTTIKFSINNVTNAKIEIYNIRGQIIRTINAYTFPNRGLESNGVVWDGKDDYGKTVPSGIYLYKLELDGKTIETKKCLIVR